jgi:uncharacterized membrane protein YphA (DoxX/SURF4 family)
MKTLRIISRTIVGLVFMFSGFVKGVDPLGSVYKFNEYFEAYHIEWLNSLALILAVMLCAIEFTIGVMLVFGVKPKLSSWLAFIMMFFFTGLTLLSAINNPVSDCGCFGDAVKLTNWQTFHKNVVLIIFALFLILSNKHAKPAFSLKNEISIMILGTGIILFVSIFSLRHLPVIDFLPWKVGNKISEQVIPTSEKSEVFLIYKDKKTGQTYEYTSKTLPWKDSVKMANIEFVEQKKKITQPYKEAPIHDFVIMDMDGNILTDKIVANPCYQFILVAYDLNKTQKKAYALINRFVEGCDKDSVSFVGLTGSIPVFVDSFRHDVQVMYPFYNVDETALKTMIRSNPGLLLLKNGEVLAKWGWRDIPEYADVKKKYLK